MRVVEFINEAKRAAYSTTPHDPNPGWELLNRIKEDAAHRGRLMAGSYQLFVPRQNSGAATARDRRLSNLSNPYAWDDEGNLKPRYADWERGPKEMNGLGESAPVLAPGRAPVTRGSNKPSNAILWTSTAYKSHSGWTSDWAQWTHRNQPSWFSSTGYLYRVKPNQLIFELSDSHDAEHMFRALQQLGRASEDVDSYDTWEMRSKFPWDQVARHVDAVWHGGYRSDEFTAGWDVESTAWFNANGLELIGEVPVAPYGDDE